MNGRTDDDGYTSNQGRYSNHCPRYASNIPEAEQLAVKSTVATTTAALGTTPIVTDPVTGAQTMTMPTGEVISISPTDSSDPASNMILPGFDQPVPVTPSLAKKMFFEVRDVIVDREIAALLLANAVHLDQGFDVPI